MTKTIVIKPRRIDGRLFYGYEARLQDKPYSKHYRVVMQEFGYLAYAEAEAAGRESFKGVTPESLSLFSA